MVYRIGTAAVIVIVVVIQTVYGTGSTATADYSATIAEQQHNNGCNHDDEVLITKATGYGDDVESLISAMERGRRGLVHYFVMDVLKRNGGGNSSNNKLKCMHRDDLLQEGAIGLSKAVDRWDPDTGGKFSSYAAYWIRAAVYRGIADCIDVAFRVPECASTALRKAVKVAADLGIELNGEDGEGEDDDVVVGTGDNTNYRVVLAEAAGLTEKQVQRALQVQSHRQRGSVLSFESRMQKGRDCKTDSTSAIVAGLATSELEFDMQREHCNNPN